MFERAESSRGDGVWTTIAFDLRVHQPHGGGLVLRRLQEAYCSHDRGDEQRGRNRPQQQPSHRSLPSFSRTLRLASISAASVAAWVSSRRCLRVAYSGSLSQWFATPFALVRSEASEVRSRATSAATSFGSGSPIYGGLILCLKPVE